MQPGHEENVSLVDVTGGKEPCNYRVGVRARNERVRDLRLTNRGRLPWPAFDVLERTFDAYRRVASPLSPPCQLEYG